MIDLGPDNDRNHMKWGIRHHYGYGVFIDYVEKTEKFTPCIASVPTVTLGDWLTLKGAKRRTEQFLQASLSVFRLRGDLPNDNNELWNNDLIQFARLLREIYAHWWPPMKELESNMDLTREQINGLFDRAEKVWEASKQMEERLIAGDFDE